MSFILDYFRSNTDYTQYDYTDYRRYTTMLESGLETAYKYLPEVDTQGILETTQDFVCDNIYYLGSAVLVGTFAIATMKYIRSLPQYPLVNAKTSLNHLKVSIEVPNEIPQIPQVNIVFCIDTSGSMTEHNREQQVKEGVKKVMENALKVSETIEGADIRIGIVGFNNNASTICEPAKITSSLIGASQKFSSQGGTSIVKGLTAATMQLETMAKTNQQAAQALIFLSDGQESLNQSEVQAIHQRLTKINAQLFAIGIGKEHNSNTLKTIAPNAGKFTGTYIATSETQTIVKTISEIYQGVMATFKDFSVSCPQLQAEDWTLQGDVSPLSEGQTRVLKVKVKKEKYINLSKIQFKLGFTDPKGRKGTINLPKLQGIIDPQVWA